MILPLMCSVVFQWQNDITISGRCWKKTSDNRCAFWAYGAGALGDMGCHIMDPAFKVVGLGYPTDVQCTQVSIYEKMWTPDYFPGRKKLLWDAANMKITNFDEAIQFVKRE